jgi:hypothetical protein
MGCDKWEKWGVTKKEKWRETHLLLERYHLGELHVERLAPPEHLGEDTWRVTHVTNGKRDK